MNSQWMDKLTHQQKNKLIMNSFFYIWDYEHIEYFKFKILNTKSTN